MNQHSSVPPRGPHQLKNNGSRCDEVRALIPAYSIGATDPDETLLVESLLGECPEAVAELGEYLALAEAMQALQPQHLPAAPAAASVPAMPTFSQITRHNTMQHVPPPTETTQAHAAHRPAAQPTNRPAMRTVATTETAAQRDYLSRLRTLNAAGKPAPQPERRRSSGWALAAVLALVLLIGSNAFWFVQLGNLQSGQAELLALLSNPPTPVPLSISISASTVHHRSLIATNDGAPESEATLVWDSSTSIGTLVVNKLPTLAGGRVYQLWLVRDGEEISLGHFKVDENGAGTLMFHSPVPIEDGEAVGISAEPETGSEKPTTPHLVIGQI